MKRVTIIDVAKACGCSKTTVACALDEKTACKVVPALRARIFEAVRLLGYVPNRSAKALRQRKTFTVGILLPEPANTFYGNLVLNLQRRLSDAGYTALFVFWASRDDAETIVRARDQLISRGVDGIITGSPPGIEFENCPVPVVYMKGPGNYDSFSSFPRMREAYLKLFRILEAKGCSNYALMTLDLESGRGRIIRELMEEKGIPVRDEFMFTGIASPEHARNVMNAFLKRRGKLPDAVLANNDYIALAAMSAALENGIEVPGRMKFVGFDGIAEGAYLHPSLTTFYVPPAAIAENLVSLFLRRLADPSSPFRALSLMPELIIRDSI